MRGAKNNNPGYPNSPVWQFKGHRQARMVLILQHEADGVCRLELIETAKSSTRPFVIEPKSMQ